MPLYVSDKRQTLSHLPSSAVDNGGHGGGSGSGRGSSRSVVVVVPGVVFMVLLRKMVMVVEVVVVEACRKKRTGRRNLGALTKKSFISVVAVFQIKQSIMILY